MTSDDHRWALMTSDGRPHHRYAEHLLAHQAWAVHGVLARCFGQADLDDILDDYFIRRTSSDTRGGTGSSRSSSSSGLGASSSSGSVVRDHQGVPSASAASGGAAADANDDQLTFVVFARLQIEVVGLAVVRAFHAALEEDGSSKELVLEVPLAARLPDSIMTSDDLLMTSDDL